MNRRREFLLTTGALLTAPLARAQSPRRPFRVAHISINSLQTRKHLNDALELGLREQGFTIGQDLLMEQAAGDGSVERLKELVRDAVARNPDVIVTGANIVTLAVKASTPSIPIVMAIGQDVVSMGLVRSLRQPGENVTGLTLDVGDGIAIKQLELLKELVPGTSRVGVLWEPPGDRYKAALDKAAPALGLSVAWIRYSDDLERDFGEVKRERCDALLLFTSTRVYRRAAEINAVALRLRIPCMYGVSDFLAADGLISYGPNLPDLFRRAARYVREILRGAKPGDLPIEQPARIDLEINLKTARTLGIKVPPTLLLRAERIIE